jgi:hypothetical protein
MDGMSLITAFGTLYPVNVNWNGDQLNLNCYRFDENGNWNKGNQICGKSIYFSPAWSGEFFNATLSTCPSQPPSILPISSSGIEMSSYFLVSSDRVSQRMWSRILRVSSFRMAVRR